MSAGLSIPAPAPLRRLVAAYGGPHRRAASSFSRSSGAATTPRWRRTRPRSASRWTFPGPPSWTVTASPWRPPPSAPPSTPSTLRRSRPRGSGPRRGLRERAATWTTSSRTSAPGGSSPGSPANFPSRNTTTPKPSAHQFKGCEMMEEAGRYYPNGPPGRQPRGLRGHGRRPHGPRAPLERAPCRAARGAILVMRDAVATRLIPMEMVPEVAPKPVAVRTTIDQAIQFEAERVLGATVAGVERQGRRRHRPGPQQRATSWPWRWRPPSIPNQPAQSKARRLAQPRRDRLLRARVHLQAHHPRRGPRLGPLPALRHHRRGQRHAHRGPQDHPRRRAADQGRVRPGGGPGPLLQRGRREDRHVPGRGDHVPLHAPPRLRPAHGPPPHRGEQRAPPPSEGVVHALPPLPLLRPGAALHASAARPGLCRRGLGRLPRDPPPPAGPARARRPSASSRPPPATRSRPCWGGWSRRVRARPPP